MTFEVLHNGGQVQVCHVRENVGIMLTHQDDRACGYGDEEVGPHEEQPPPDVPHAVPQIATTILQTVSQGIANVNHFLTRISKTGSCDCSRRLKADMTN